MEHIVNNPALNHFDVAILCWAAENTPFTIESLNNRFSHNGFWISNMKGNFVEPVEAYLQSLTEQFYLHKETDSDGIAHFSYIPPPEDSKTPPLFKEFCRNYSAAGGRVKSAAHCFDKFKQKTKKQWKSTMKLLGPALDAQLEERERWRNRGKFVPEMRNLLTWINERGWEDLISDDGSSGSWNDKAQMQVYRSWTDGKYGPTAKLLLLEAQYMSFFNGTNAFRQIKMLLSERDRKFLFEHAHTSFFNGMTAGLSCYDFLVKLYQSKI